MALDFNEIRKKNNINVSVETRNAPKTSATTKTTTIDFNKIREKNGITSPSTQNASAPTQTPTQNAFNILNNANKVQSYSDVTKPVQNITVEPAAPQNTPTFKTIEEAQEYAKNNNINISNSNLEGIKQTQQNIDNRNTLTNLYANKIKLPKQTTYKTPYQMITNTNYGVSETEKKAYEEGLKTENKKGVGDVIGDAVENVWVNTLGGTANAINTLNTMNTKVSGKDATSINAQNLLNYNNNETKWYDMPIDVARTALNFTMPNIKPITSSTSLLQSSNSAYKRLEEIYKANPNNLKLKKLYEEITNGTYKGSADELQKELNDIQISLYNDFKNKYTADELEAVAKRQQKNADEYGTFGEMAMNAFGQVGNMIPSMLTSVIAPPAGLATLGLSATDSAMNEALQEGADYNQALTYGALVGGTEAGIEKLSGGLSNRLMNVKGIINPSNWTKGIKNQALKAGIDTILDVAGEGVEEVASAVINPIIQKITYNPNAEMITGEEMWLSFRDSILPTLLMQGGGVAVNKINSYHAKQVEQIQNSNLPQEQKTDLINKTTTERDKLLNEVQNVEQPVQNIAPQSPNTQIQQQTNEVIPQQTETQQNANLTPTSAQTYKAIRSDVENANLDAENKPQGLYLSNLYDKNVSDFSFPFKDSELNTTYEYDITPTKPLNVESFELQTDRSSGPIQVDAGVSALKTLVGDNEFNRINSLNKQQLQEELSSKYPQYDFSRYFDKLELMSAYGGIMAREQGYDAIIPQRSTNKWTEDVDNEIVALNNSILKRTETQDLQKTEQSDFDNALNRAVTDKNSKGKTILGKINDFAKNKIQQLLGIDVSNRQHTLADNDIRHMLNEHGNAEIEAKRGQIPITEADVKRIPSIIDSPDDIILGSKHQDGQTVRYIKKFEDGINFVVEVVPEKSGALKIKTMWKKPIAVVNSTNTPNLTSKTEGNMINSTSNNNIIQSNENYVNNQNILPSVEQLQARDLKQGEEISNTLNMKKQKDGLKEAIDSISKNENANKVSYTNDFYRNIRTALGEKAGKELTGIFDTQKLSYVKQKQNYANELKTEIVDKLGIKMGSEMSADVQRYGEKLISQAELKTKYPNDWQKIVEADKWFRSKYNKLIDEINATRKEIYPNVEEQIKETKESLLKTYDLIKQAEKTGIAPYKVDQDIQNSIKKLETKIDKKRKEIKNFENKNSNYEQNDKYTALIDEVQQLEQNKNELEKTIGIRYEEKVARLKKRAQRLSDTLNSEELWRGKIIPKRDNYYRHFQEMTEGFKALHNIFDTPAEISSQLAGTSEYTKPNTKYLGIAQKRTTNETEYDAVKGFLNYLEPATYAINIDPFTTELRAITKIIKSNTADTKNANKLIEYLDDFANSLAGKTNPFDRSLQKLTNRKTIKTIEWLSNRIKSNAVLGNINSSISQILNLPQVVGKIKDPVKIAQGVFDLATGKGKYQDSQFIQERYHSDIESQFNTKLLQQPKKFATWMLGALDEGVTKTGWNAVYRQAIEKGIENPVQYADDTMRNLVAGRGIGERTLAQESKLVNLIMPFTVETGNYWRVMKDFIDEKDFGGMFITFVVGWLLNKGIEAIGASGKTFDPIDAIYDAITEEDITLLERFGRVGGEILSSMPMGQQIATMYPEYGADLGVVKLPARESLFGSNDPTRFGTGNMFTNIFQHPITSVAMPWGGTQTRRTLEGIETIVKGGDYKTNSKGEEQLKFPVSLEDMNPAEKFGKITQILTLGKNSTSEAKDYFENGALSAVQTKGLKKAKELDMSAKEFYDIMQKIKDIEIPTRKNKEGKDEAIPGARKKLILEELNKTNLNNEQKKLMYDIFYSKELKGY